MPELKQQRTRPQDHQSCGRLFSLPDAALYLGISYWSVRDLVANGTLPRVKLPLRGNGDGRSLRRILIDRRDLDRLIDTNKEADAF